VGASGELLAIIVRGILRPVQKLRLISALTSRQIIGRNKKRKERREEKREKREERREEKRREERERE
jgi:hypothetical protein